MSMEAFASMDDEGNAASCAKGDTRREDEGGEGGHEHVYKSLGGVLGG